MMTKRIILCFTIVLAALVGFYGTAFTQSFVYDMDGSQLVTETFDSLVAVQFDPGAAFNAANFAVIKPYLQDDFEFHFLSGHYAVFGIEPAYDFEYVAGQLREDANVFMVNPVCNSLDRAYYVDNQIAVRFLDGVSAQTISDAFTNFGLNIIDTAFGSDTIYFAEYDGSTDLSIFEICNTLYEQEICLYAQPDFIYTSEFFADVPQDPYFNEQWHHHNTGQTGGTIDADIDLPEAWNLKTEDAPKLLAILDSGFDMEHEDLPQYCFYWPYDVIGDTVYNSNVWLPDGDPSPSCFDFDIACWHGTMVLGLVAPIINNTIGLAGIEDAGSIMPIKISDKEGRFRDRSVIKAFRYASSRPHPPEVYSCSWSLGMYYPDVEHELERLYNNGHPVFFSAGNYGVVEYPAYSKYVFAVGATDHNDDVPIWSGHGDSLDICAPGVNVWSFDLSGENGINSSPSQCNGDMDYFCSYTGTSVSAPIVASIATKILASRLDLIHKTGNAEPLYDLLRNTADDLYTTGHDNTSGWGRLNAYRAMIAISHGDVNLDHDINVSDAIYVINYVFVGGPSPIPHLSLGDANCDGVVNVSDVVWIANYVFVGGDPPPVCYLNLPE